MITCVESGLLKVWKEGSTETVSQSDFSVLLSGVLYLILRLIFIIASFIIIIHALVWSYVNKGMLLEMFVLLKMYL